jgi:hypothetical protein
MASKIAEANAGIHTLAMAVAVCVYFSLTKSLHSLASLACDQLEIIRFHLYRTVYGLA